MVLTGKGSGGGETSAGCCPERCVTFAEEGGGDLRDFISLLSDLPPEAGLGKSPKR